MTDIQTKTADPTVDVVDSDKPRAKRSDIVADDASTDAAGTAVQDDGTGLSDAADTAAGTAADNGSGNQEGSVLPPAPGNDRPGFAGHLTPDPSADLNKIRIITKALKNIERDIANVIRLLESGATLPPRETVQTLTSIGAVATMAREEAVVFSKPPADGRIVEGVFDGQNMVGSAGKLYTVPANYASKSKLVEGDMLKLTITPRGSFIYKQIGPIERNRVMAVIGFDPTIGEYYAADETRRWNVLKASVTYYRGDIADEVVLLVPKNAPSKWAAVENIIKGNPLDGSASAYQQPMMSPGGNVPLV